MRSSVRCAAIAVSLALYGCATDGAESSGPPTPATSLGLVSEIESQSDWLDKDEQVLVRWTLTNLSAVPLSLPRWQVPTTDLEADVFDVTRDGVQVQYYGRVYKRAEPTAADLVTLAPGESLSAIVDLSSVYRMARAGEYMIQFRGAPMTVFDGSTRLALEVRSNLATTLRGDENPGADLAKPPSAPENLVGSGYRSCSSSQKTRIQAGFSRAESYAANARSYLDSGARGARYTTWFGTYKSSRYSTVRSHFRQISDAISNERFTFDCGCNDSAYAYVYPDDPYVVYLCNAFWSAPTSGTDSKGGTIVHETSHFTVVGGTDDWEYGQSSCRSLAQSQPSHAIANADSHEYFAENSPAQN